MSGGSSPHIETPEVEEEPEKPDILFGEDEAKKKKNKAIGTKRLQVPITGGSGKSGLGIPS